MSDVTQMPQFGTMRDRRQFYRASVVARSALRVRVWRLAPGVPLRQRPMPSQELRVGVRQVCVGGLTVEAPRADERLASVRETDRLRIEITFADRVALVEGRFRGKVVVPPVEQPAGSEVSSDNAATADVAPSAAPLRTGVVFQGREADVAYREARAALGNIVGCVQREELRERRRMEREAQRLKDQGTMPPTAPGSAAA